MCLKKQSLTNHVYIYVLFILCKTVKLKLAVFKVLPVIYRKEDVICDKL